MNTCWSFSSKDLNLIGMSFKVPLTLHLPLPFLHKPLHFLPSPIKTLQKSHICFAFPPSNQNPTEYEESRWVREEQRWLREEQRWLREEQRWNDERQTLIQQINNLKIRIKELEIIQNSVPGTSVSDTVAKIAKLLQVPKDSDSGKNVNRISESLPSAAPLLVEADVKDQEIVVKEVIDVPERKDTVKRRSTLRSGSEGEEVRALQEALQKLGFYSGEEDIEFSSFSSGTERAVKTWQSTLGAKEDGIMTAELLELLYKEQKIGTSSIGVTENQENKVTDPNKIQSSTQPSENGSPFTSIKDKSSVPEHRVFLLGENRWEEPSRLSGSSKTKSGSSNPKTKCISCRGEGRVLCMECDGTGEPNIEEQFMEWVDEGTKCTYCEGLGYTACDVCGGK